VKEAAPTSPCRVLERVTDAGCNEEQPYQTKNEVESDGTNHVAPANDIKLSGERSECAAARC